jgi:hypothetical protein
MMSEVRKEAPEAQPSSMGERNWLAWEAGPPVTRRSPSIVMRV